MAMLMAFASAAGSSIAQLAPCPVLGAILCMLSPIQTTRPQCHVEKTPSRFVIPNDLSPLPEIAELNPIPDMISRKQLSRFLYIPR
ncbi:hypothetical protein BDV11DRAFT_190572 [Aspergillus similis]